MGGFKRPVTLDTVGLFGANLPFIHVETMCQSMDFPSYWLIFLEGPRALAYKHPQPKLTLPINHNYHTEKSTQSQKPIKRLAHR